jgi:hypothetical protein
LINVSIDSEAVTWEKREMAVRTLVVAVEDLNISDPDVGYMLLSEYFLVCKDVPSSYAALATAREEISALPDSLRKQAALERVQARMASYPKDLGRSERTKH